jgi:KDO2-lipid IV(A) lauroyltransferase
MLKRFGDWIVGLLFLGAVAGAVVINVAGKELFTRVIARILYLAVGSRRRVALRNIERAFGPKYTPAERKAIARESFRVGVDTVVEGFSLFAHGGPENLVRNIRINRLERLKKALEGGKGVICVSAHYGPFPFMGSAFSMAGIKGFGFLYRRPKNAAVANRFDDWIRMAGFRNIVDHPKQEAVRNVLRELGAGSTICILIDQHFPAGVEVPFFGQPSKTGVGAAVLAARSGAPIVPIHIQAVGTPGVKYVVEVDEPVPPPASTSEEDLASCMAALTRRVEDWVTADPRQWFWVHRRWKQLDRMEDEAGKR